MIKRIDLTYDNVDFVSAITGHPKESLRQLLMVKASLLSGDLTYEERMTKAVVRLCIEW